MRDQLRGARKVAALPDLFGADGALVAGDTADGLHVLLVDAPHLYAREGGGPYLGPDGKDWPDNHLRFAALSWVGAQLALGRVGSWRPDVLHLHDWQAALAAAYVHGAKRTAKQTRPGTLLTIHNLAFQGVFAHDLGKQLRLPPAALAHDGIEYWGNLSFLKAGVQWCDLVNTVSPTYAREILTPDLGMGMDGLLRHRSKVLSGIVNGIDDAVWNPATDPEIEARYDATRLDGKAACKRALQVELGLAPRADAPLLAVVSRMSPQKGLDLLLSVLPQWLGAGGQVAMLGSGEPALEHAWSAAARAAPDAVAVRIGYDEPLAHRLVAGADLIGVPSRFEPCGLTQLYGLRYGTLPLVHRVGGLADTVVDADEAALREDRATGFAFSGAHPDALAQAMRHALDGWRHPAAWKRVMRRAMAQDTSWRAPAARYAALYRETLGLA